MPIEIRMPALSPTMTEGNLARWLKKEGDEVHSGDVIAEIETDKATMEYEAADEGRLGRIIVPEGAQGIKVNEPIAVLLAEGEDEAALAGFAAAAPGPHPNPPPTAGEGAVIPPPSAPPSPQATEGAAATARVAMNAVANPSPQAGEGTGPVNPPPQAGEGRAGVSPNGAARVFASPLARRMAQHAGLDLGALRGSGPQGRIVKADIDAALARGTAPRPAASPPAAPPAARPATPAAVFAQPQVLALAGSPPFTAKPHSAMRRVIARRLTEAKQTIPHHYMSVDCTIDDLVKIRASLNAKTDTKISINDFVIRAAALALRQVPAANASWSDEAILLWERADISVAVALDDGLITPIVKGADQKGLAQIAVEMKDLAERARAGKLKLEEFQGGTFSVSNLGMYGVRDFAAVINPPQGCILAVGAGEKRPVVQGGQLAIATVMTCTLSSDHRVVDGAVAAQFLAAFKKLVEDPLTMLL